VQGLDAMHSKDAFHRVPDFARNDWDAVECVPTRGGALGQRALPRFLARGCWPALPATRAVAENIHTSKKGISL
jgi:hypothetical protein